MNRRRLSVFGGVAAMALLATTVPGAATAAPTPDTPDAGPLAAPQHEDDRPDMLEEKRRESRATALEQVVNGEAQVQDRNGSKSVKVAPGQWAQYELQASDEVLSFLVEFGDTQDPRFPDAPAGPLHNEIPEPDRETDNTTYWVDDFNRKHYMDMFFDGTGETFKGVYEEMSSGRYTLNGDVSDWVTVENNEASYGETESNVDMTRFIDDTAEAWLQAQRDKGMTDTEIGDYLQTYDQWDRYDHDGDGDFNEPDGYIDHFQAIHAGEGEEAGAPSWAIWSHRWAANIAGTYEVGPEGAPFGGIEIGDTGMWIRDYTTEPENGGLGVFAHEYAHDLGIPDFYDTSGGENSTGFWTLMSSGSWLSHGDGAIGTTPNHMGAHEKLQLGWLDYKVVQPGESAELQIGPSTHATKKDQALIAILPKGSKSTDIGEAAEGENYFYSGRGDDRTATVTSPEFTVPEGGALTADVKYAIEVDWDYAYAEVRGADGTWTPLATDHSTMENPNGSNENHGITGESEGWEPLTADLAGYAGETVQIRFRMVNDAAINELGFLVDNIVVGEALTEGVEDGAPEWTLDEFQIAENGVVSETFNRYYIAENRQYLGYDEVLETGPYNFGSADKPNWVEHFPYQDGLLIWYWNTSESNNNVRTHPGSGRVLPVDARGDALTWSDGTLVRNRIQAFDSTFGTEPTDAITLHKPSGAKLAVPRQQAERVFDDRFAERYYDEANPMGSVRVPNTGTRIEVLGQNRRGMMDLRVN